MRKIGIILGILLLSFNVYAAEELFVFNWTEYMPDKVLAQFQKETGIKVIYSTYESNESMYAKLSIVKGEGYDLVFPSNYFVNRMISDGLLQPIDKSKLSNFRNLNPDLLNKPYDPQNQYSVPYLWGATGIGVNTQVVKADKIRSWKDLWKPEFKGKLLLTDDQREVFGMALKILGYSGNDKDPKHIEEAYQKLLELKPNIRLFASDSPKQPFLNKEVVIGMIWNGEIYMAAKENPKIKFIYPEEGVMLWVDSMTIPKGAKNVENAYKFINFILQPEIAKTISEGVGYASPNIEAVKLMNPKVRNNKTVYPDDDIVKKGEFQTDVGDAILTYERLWEQLKAKK
ncbi:MAG: extracellular solute-binding protein [Desulfobacteraceae bacterium]|nr:extracellular solute-binding protein [Desulfobacteraceae bacterium]